MELEERANERANLMTNFKFHDMKSRGIYKRGFIDGFRELKNQIYFRKRIKMLQDLIRDVRKKNMQYGTTPERIAAEANLCLDLQVTFKHLIDDDIFDDAMDVYEQKTFEEVK